jgi:hypothetical protein
MHVDYGDSPPPPRPIEANDSSNRLNLYSTLPALISLLIALALAFLYSYCILPVYCLYTVSTVPI